MTTFKAVVVLLALVAGACTTVPPVPVAVDPSVPAVAEADGLRARLRVLSRGEAAQVFGDWAGAQLGVVELIAENRGATPVAAERKWFRMVAPDGRDLYPASSFDVANLARPGSGMISSGSNVLDAIQLLFGVARLVENREYARRWDHLMPDTFKLAPGEEQRMLVAFPTAHWAPGLWRLELPFNTGTGAAGPHLSIPLKLKATGRSPD